MKKIIFTVLAGAFFSVNAQTIQDAQREIDNENYFRAKQLLRKLQTDPASDKNAVSFYLGNAYLNDGDADSAKLFYTAAFNSESKNPIGYVANGKLALLNGKKEDAKQNFDRALQISKFKNAEIQYQVGDAYLTAPTKDFAEAVKALEEAVRLSPKSTNYFITLGDAYLQSNEAGKALSKYETARDLDTKSAVALIKIARVNRNGRIYPDAITALESAIKVDANLALAYKELGEVYYLSKQYDKVGAMFKKYMELNSDDAAAKFQYINFLFSIKDYENTITETTKALQSEPNNALYLRVLAASNLELKRYKDGYDAVKRFWAIPDVKAKAIDYVNSAKLASLTGDTTNAILYFTTALQNDSTNCDLLGEYAKALYLAKRYSDATAYYNKKQESCGSLSALDIFNVGRAYYFNKEYANADTFFAQFITRTPSTPDGYLWRGKNLALMDDPTNPKFIALPHYQQFVEKFAADPAKNKRGLAESYLYIGSYYAQNNDVATAKSYFNKMLELDPADAEALEMLKLLK
jgi:tetratricopeptide (TPR) repeat protein